MRAFTYVQLPFPVTHDTILIPAVQPDYLGIPPSFIFMQCLIELYHFPNDHRINTQSLEPFRSKATKGP